MVRGASSDVPHGVLHYGTTQPFDVSEVKAKERNKYLPLHLQEVRDEQGRKRLHGAFTGGFSAGYYNTVGSKEGWQPSSFVSSRKNKQKYVHNPEMYMDEEDLEDHKGQIRISSEYSSEQSSLEQKSKQSSVQIESTPATELFASIALDIIYPTESTLQSKLLVKNGWKMNINLSNPDYERLMSKVSKNRNGLGYKNDDLFCKDSSYGNSLGRPVKKSANRMDFAVFDDNEDDNIFGTFSKSKYNTCIGGVSQSESSHEGSSSYDSKSSSRNSNINAISGFTAGSMITTSFNLYSRVNVPPEYVPSVPRSLDLKGYGKNSKKYTIEERREILSEKPSNLKRSVFSYLSIKSQNQLADYIENAEKCRRIRKQFSDNVSNANISIVPKTSVNKEVALAALQGFIPFSNDLNKRERYKKFLLAHAEDKMYFVSKLEGLSEQELQHEQNEFTKAALMFRPMGVNMASKFASAKSPDVCTLPKRSVVEIPDKITPEYKKIGESPKEVIVDVPDEGLKRVVKPFFPVKLLSKRFGLPPITPPSDVEQYKNQAANPMFSFSQIKSDMDHENQKTGKFSAINEHEKLEIKEPEKPSLEIFKAIFSDSGSDTEEPERPSKKPQDLLQSKVKPSFDRQNEENYTPNKKVKVAQSDFRPIFRSRKYRDKN